MTRLQVLCTDRVCVPPPPPPPQLDGRSEGAVDSREKLLEFGFDYCYWSVDAEDPRYASQEEVRPPYWEHW